MVGCRSFGDRGRGQSMASCVSAASAAVPAEAEPSREDIRDTPIRRSSVEGHRSAGAGVKVGGSSEGSARCGVPRSRSFAGCAQARQGGENAAGGRSVKDSCHVGGETRRGRED